MRRILTVVAATLLCVSCGDDDGEGGDADGESRLAATVPVSAASGPATTLGPPPVSAGDAAATAPTSVGADTGSNPADDVTTGSGDEGARGQSEFCVANDRFSTLLAQFFTASDPEAAWRDVREQLDVVLDALPPEIRGPEADAGRAYYDTLEEHFEEHDWNLQAALEDPPDVPPAVLLYEDDVSDYTRANCS